MSVHLYNLYKVQLIGYKPSELLDDDNLMLEEEEHLLILAFSVICEIEKAIELNETNNRRRERWFHLTMVLVKLQILLASVLFAGGSVIHALQ